jgi:hypothetical protein
MKKRWKLGKRRRSKDLRDISLFVIIFSDKSNRSERAPCSIIGTMRKGRMEDKV